jgi:hypothetical protein
MKIKVFNFLRVPPKGSALKPGSKGGIAPLLKHGFKGAIPPLAALQSGAKERAEERK